MREILFRGISVDNGKWVDGNLTKTFHLAFIDDIKFMPADSIKAYNFIEVNHETIGQYTGLKDKNGKRIFEGDSGIIENKQTVFVKFNDGAFILYDLWTGILFNFLTEELPLSRLEITGTIHDKQGE